jgi:haloacid dehalogenase superfamily, subfamily IA, variant 3 with third motif having DD or ED/haloacid dehalogenase superfamily, subfamily IA, variant 1 with third motif having Dx(3-4)D or Dx(3-4)E
VSSAKGFVCKAILFDLDGVLVNSAECVERTWREWSARHQLDADEVIGVAHGRRTVETVRAVAPHLDALAEVEELEAKEALTTEGVYEIEGARELIASLPRDTWAIVTSGTRVIAEFRLKYVGIPIPRVMVCADEISNGKPHPEGYLTAAARLAVQPADCVVIEDTPPGIAAAHNAQMRAIAVSTTYPPEHLADADAVVRRLTDLQVAASGDAIRIKT